MKPTIQEMAQALKIKTLPCQVARDGNRGYCLKIPSKITQNGGIETLSNVKICNFGEKKMAVRMRSISRYEAHAFPDSDVIYIQPRLAMKSPQWGGRFGALPELTLAMKRAGLI